MTSSSNFFESQLQAGDVVGALLYKVGRALGWSKGPGVLERESERQRQPYEIRQDSSLL